MAIAVSSNSDNRNNYYSKKASPFPYDEGFVFGTVYKITYQSEDNLKEEIETELKKVDNSLSPFNPNSVITRVNHNEKTEVDSFFVHVFHLSKKISDETHGAFDITVAPLVNAWGFGFKKSTGVDSLIVDSLRQMIGYQKNRFTEQPDYEKKTLV